MEFKKIPYNISCVKPSNIKMQKVRQKFTTSKIDDVSSYVLRALHLLACPDLNGKRIAVTAGSRGVANIAAITKTTIDFLKKCGAQPFIVPAMGSHGGATAEGQKKVLHGYGITEEAMKAPILSDMDTLYIGKTADGVSIVSDAQAFKADYIVVINRVKAHSDFKAEYESGICKMMLVGLGKQEGATLMHKAGSSNFGHILPEAADVFISTGKILFAIALVENAKDETYMIECLPPWLIKARGKKLLEIAKASQAHLLIGDANLLLVDEIGKNISGAGMDPNVTGRPPTGAAGFPVPPASRIAVLGITPVSKGNGTGVGMADFVSLECVQQLDLALTYTNALTTGVPAAARIPVVANSDKDILDLATLACGKNNWGEMKIIHIKNTLELEYIEVSANMFSTCDSISGKIEIYSTPFDMEFDSVERIKRLAAD